MYYLYHCVEAIIKNYFAHLSILITTVVMNAAIHVEVILQGF